MSTYDDIVNDHEARLGELETNSAKKVYSATNYAISVLGINAQSTLLDLVQALPSYAIATYWINADSEIGRTVRTAMADFGWASNVFGDLILDKTGATTYITFNCYNQPRRAYCSHSTINNVGFSSWSYSEDYLHLSGGAVNGSLIVNNGTASTVGGYYVKDKDGNTRGALQMNSDNKYIFAGGGVSNTVQVGSSNTSQNDIYGTAINLKNNTKVNGTLEASGTITSDSDLIVGNGGASTAHINVFSSGQGYIQFYGGKQSTYYSRIRQSTTYTANYTLTMPAASGVIATASSDVRLKKNIVDADGNALETVNKMRIRSFDWNEDGHHNTYGIVADEIEEILPTLVHYDGEDTEDEPSYKYIDLLEYCGLLAKAVQELSAEVNELKNK